MKKYSFAPIVNEKSKVLILGTMPGEKSLSKNEYYANSTNKFWEIISNIIENNIINVTYDEKKKFLLKNHIAIWDVLMQCEREGSLDVNISAEVPNDFKTFFKEYPNIKVVFFNGSKAEDIFCKKRLADEGRRYGLLPSTSSANTSMTFDKKLQIWKQNILEFL